MLIVTYRTTVPSNRWWTGNDWRIEFWTYLYCLFKKQSYVFESCSASYFCDFSITLLSQTSQLNTHPKTVNQTKQSGAPGAWGPVVSHKSRRNSIDTYKKFPLLLQNVSKIRNGFYFFPCQGEVCRLLYLTCSCSFSAPSNNWPQNLLIFLCLSFSFVQLIQNCWSTI